MRTRTLTLEHHALVRLAVLALLIIGLAGCAHELQSLRAPATQAPYVGLFTGEFVDGRALYRFPSIEVVGSRSSLTHELSEPDGS